MIPGERCVVRGEETLLDLETIVHRRRQRRTGEFLRYSLAMDNQKYPRHLSPIRRAIIEVGFIIFLFYSNLLMGEFTHANGHGKSLVLAVQDIFTTANFLIAVVSALAGYVVFEYLRKKL